MSHGVDVVLKMFTQTRGHFRGMKSLPPLLIGFERQLGEPHREGSVFIASFETGPWSTLPCQHLG